MSVRVDFVENEDGFNMILSTFLLKDQDKWKVYRHDTSYEPFKSELIKNMISLSSYGNKGIVSDYPPHPNHNGIIYGLTKGYKSNTGSYGYEFFKYEDKRWKSLVKFSEKNRLSPKEVTNLDKMYELNKIAPPHLLGNLLYKASTLK